MSHIIKEIKKNTKKYGRGFKQLSKKIWRYKNFTEINGLVGVYFDQFMAILVQKNVLKKKYRNHQKLIVQNYVINGHC